MLFFAGTLFPALGFIDVYPMRFSFVADHFQYLASLGPIALAAAGAAALGRSGRGVALVWLVVLAGLTYAQVKVYRDEEALWSDTLAENPDSFLAHNNLGRYYGLRKEFARALPHFQRTIEILPSDYIAETNLAETLNRLGRYDEAIVHLRNVLAIEPRWADAHFFLWDALSQTGRMDEAVKHLRLEAALKATFEAHLHAGQLLRRAGRPRDALLEISRAEQLSPGNANAALVSGNLHSDLGDLRRAVVAYREAIRRRPDWALAHANLGGALERLGRFDAAEQRYLRALEIDPSDADVQQSLERLRARRSRDAGALRPPTGAEAN